MTRNLVKCKLRKSGNTLVFTLKINELVYKNRTRGKELNTIKYINRASCVVTGMLCCKNTAVDYYHINSWSKFGVGPDYRKNLNMKGCLPTMIHKMETRTKFLV